MQPTTIAHPNPKHVQTSDGSNGPSESYASKVQPQKCYHNGTGRQMWACVGDGILTPHQATQRILQKESNAPHSSYPDETIETLSKRFLEKPYNHGLALESVKTPIPQGQSFYTESGPSLQEAVRYILANGGMDTLHQGLSVSQAPMGGATGAAGIVLPTDEPSPTKQISTDAPH